MNDLKWEKYYDADDNTYWQALGTSLWGSRSYYIIRQKLRGDRVVYIEDSTEDLWIEPRSYYREFYGTLEEAKRDMFHVYNARLQEQL